MPKSLDLPSIVADNMSIFDKMTIKLGLQRNNILFWSWDKGFANAGDWITPYIFYKKKGFPPKFSKCKHVNASSTVLFGAGSIFHHIKKPDVAVIWGSGIMSRNNSFQRPKEILAVRGKYTYRKCESMGLEVPEVFGDPGIILPKYFLPTDTEKKYAVGIIPHFVNMEEAKHIYGNYPEVIIIDITNPIEKVISEIIQCESTLSSSLHGIIISHAYGVKSSHVSFREKLKGDGIKFLDYFSSIDQETDDGPVCLSTKTGVKELKSISNRNSVPDLKNLQDGLMASIPF